MGVTQTTTVIVSTQRRFSQISAAGELYWSHCISDGEYNSEVIGSSSRIQNYRAGDRGELAKPTARQIFNSSMVVSRPASRDLPLTGTPCRIGSCRRSLLQRRAVGWKSYPPR